MMLKTTIIFGLSLAVLLALLKWVEYMFFTKDLALEAYIGLVGLFCTALGGWIGWKLTRGRKIDSSREIIAEDSSNLYNYRKNKFGLSPREFEVLVLIAGGYSYQEIADQLCVSLSTIKTHAANIFSKMDVQRRTQAVMLAQKAGLIPPLKG
jgi:DNA-binding CsgD family transcriptional regulator